MTPIHLLVMLTDDVNHHLPALRNGIIKVNGAEQPIEQANCTIEVNNLSVWLCGKAIPIEFSGIYYDTLKVQMPIGYGFKEKISIQLHRNNSFGLFAGIVVDKHGNLVEGAFVDIGGHKTITDKNDHFRIDIPLDQQTCTKSISIWKKGVGTFESDSEWPRDSSRFPIR